MYEKTLRTQRVQHASLETHGAVAWFEDDGRAHGALQHPDPVPDPPGAVRPVRSADGPGAGLAGRVGGGFGGKQEMLTEDIVVLAALRTGRPVKLEYTRAEQFIGATTRHPCGSASAGVPAGRHADRYGAAGRLQHRCLRQPRRRR